MDVVKVEKMLSKAKYIGFYPTDKPQSPSVVGLVFDYNEIHEAIEAYKLIQRTYGNSDTTLVINKRGGSIRLSIISRSKSEVFNLDNLPFEGLHEFMKVEGQGSAFVLTIFQDTEKGLIMIATNDPFSPLVVRGYSFA